MCVFRDYRSASVQMMTELTPVKRAKHKRVDIRLLRAFVAQLYLTVACTRVHVVTEGSDRGQARGILPTFGFSH